MIDICAWCGKPTPARRRGRKGARRFCPAPARCDRLFEAAARRIGTDVLAGTGTGGTGEERAKQWRGNSGAGSEG